MTTNVIAEPLNGTSPGSYVIYLSSLADEIPAWGSAPAARDTALRAFWPTEPILASAIYSTAGKYAALEWQLEGPPKTVSEITNWIHGVELGEGWLSLMLKTLVDLFTTDNGAFIEVVRTGDSPTAPVISLNHLDSSKCVRTGQHATPVTYYDLFGKGHLLKWYQVICLAEMPSPIEEMRGMQMCAVSRMLRAAQILRDISIYKKEKISGRFTRAVHLIGGIQTRTIEDAFAKQQIAASAQGLTRYIQPVIVGSLDPTATVSVATLNLASLPDGFDEEVAMRWYINQLSLAFGSDYQDFAPLPAGNLGTSQQSVTLDRKGRGKGTRLFMTMIEQIFNYHGILPSTVKFEYTEHDLVQEASIAQLRAQRSTTRATRITSGEITPQVAREIAVEEEDLDAKYLPELEKADADKKAEEAAKQQQQQDLEQQKLKIVTAPKPDALKTNPQQGKTSA